MEIELNMIIWIKKRRKEGYFNCLHAHLNQATSDIFTIQSNWYSSLLQSVNMSWQIKTMLNISGYEVG